MVRLVWSNDSKSYASGTVATGRVSLAGQGKGDDQEQKGYPWFSRLGVGHAANNPTP